MGLNNWMVRDFKCLCGEKISKSIWISSGHGNKKIGEVLLDLDRLPLVVDVIPIDPELTWLLWVELSAEEWVLLGLN
jgi:hypothetical protein